MRAPRAAAASRCATVWLALLLSAWGPLHCSATVTWRELVAMHQNGTLPRAGTAMQIWDAWRAADGSDATADGGASGSGTFDCLGRAFGSAPQDRKVFSQVGEDGIIEAIFKCIGEKDKFYVEFGTEACSECTTRYLRDKGWRGLLMDGSHSDPSINLHKEYMTAADIAGLFKRHGVPHPTFDHLTADLDLNTFHVLRAILNAGYRPRSVAVEYNRNFAPDQSFATIDFPSEAWDTTGKSCYYSASGLAYERIMRAHGYALVAFDLAGVNLYFIDAQSELGPAAGRALQNTFSGLSPSSFSWEAWEPLHNDCQYSTWLHVGEGAAAAARPAVLVHHTKEGRRRVFLEPETPHALGWRGGARHRRARRWWSGGDGGESPSSGR